LPKSAVLHESGKVHVGLGTIEVVGRDGDSLAGRRLRKGTKFVAASKRHTQTGETKTFIVSPKKSLPACRADRRQLISQNGLT
jgi:hypothetical protein